MRKLFVGVLVLTMTVVAGIAMAQQVTQNNPHSTHSTGPMATAEVYDIANTGAVGPSACLCRVASLSGEINRDQTIYLRNQSILLAEDQMQQCLACCATKLKNCGSAGGCNTLYQNCVASCNSHGETPSDWRCW